jgi:predicted NBD/HSP70 family sugar kinase
MSSIKEICLGLDIGGTKFACVATTVSSLLDSSFFNKPTNSNSNLAPSHGYKILTGPAFSVESFDKVLDEFISKLNDTYNSYKIVSIGIAICGLINKEGIITLCEIEILQGWNPIEHLKNKFGQQVRFLTFNDAIAGLEHIKREWFDVKDLSFIVAGNLLSKKKSS